MEINNILMCLDYNGTIDNLIEKCASCESKGSGIPTFFKGVLSMAVATKSHVSVAIISSAAAEEIKEEINIINYYASRYCKLAIPEGKDFVQYVVGHKNEEVYTSHNATTTPLAHTQNPTKKDGVLSAISFFPKDSINLVITGGDSKEDICMQQAETGVPNIFVAPKNNKDIEPSVEGGVVKDAKNNNSEGIGRALTELSRNLEQYGVLSAFEQKPTQEQPCKEEQEPIVQEEQITIEQPTPDQTEQTSQEEFSAPTDESFVTAEEDYEEDTPLQQTERPDFIPIASQISANENGFIKIADQKVTTQTEKPLSESDFIKQNFPFYASITDLSQQ